MKAIREEMTQTLQAGPGEAARQVKGVTSQAPPPSRWALSTIRATMDGLQAYTLSGVWYVLARCGLKLRSAQGQHHSPDPDYQKKVFRLNKSLRDAACHPRTVAALFLDECGYTCWPDPARDWAATTPMA